MSKTPSTWIAIGAVLGALSVVLGAMAAHALPGYLESQGFNSEATVKRIENFETAARYQTYGSLFLVLVGMLLDRWSVQWWRWSAWAMLVGMVLFAGALYSLAVCPETWRPTFGAFAPFGGSAMIVGWALLAAGAMRARKAEAGE